MSERIEVTCQHCRHTVKAPRQAAGRRGKCPYCSNSIYVPTPVDELDEIPLAPMDSDSDIDRLDRESHQVAAQLLREGHGPTEQVDSAVSDREDVVPPGTTMTVADAIISYLQALAESDLDRVQSILPVLKRSRAQAKSKIQQLMVDAMVPTELGTISSGLYQGFLRKLLEELDEG